MAGRAIMHESETLRGVATLNGRTKASVFLYRRAEDDSGSPLASADLILADAAQQDRLLERLPDEVRAEAGALLLALAAKVASEQTKPSSATAKTADPFPTIEPWPSPVAGAAILDEVCTLIRKYVVLPSHAHEAVSLWVVHTYVTDVTDYTPYIWASSPVRECGKSTLLEVLLYLAYRAQKTDGITAAALYRRIARYSPHITMLLDELDTRMRGDGGEALRGVLNAGFQRGGKITICTGEDLNDTDFNVFCPKVLAGIGRLGDTITSRSIPIRLARASKEERSKLQKIRGDRIGDETLPNRQRLLRWANDHRQQLRDADPFVPDGLGARQCDVWRPLLAIADLAGGAWPAKAKAAALALHGVAEDEGDYGLLMLEDVHGMFDEQRGAEAIFSERIVQELARREDRPWAEYGRKQGPITKNGVATLLKRFGIRPKTVRVGSETAKGYHISDLAPVFAKYLRAPAGAPSAAQPSQPSQPRDAVAEAAGVTDVTFQSEGVQLEDDRGEAWEPDPSQVEAFDS